jgi:hypothetical protein
VNKYLLYLSSNYLLNKNNLDFINAIRYYLTGIKMIISFKDRETENLFYREYSRHLPEAIQRSALRKLRIIHRGKQRRATQYQDQQPMEDLFLLG